MTDINDKYNNYYLIKIIMSDTVLTIFPRVI